MTIVRKSVFLTGHNAFQAVFGRPDLSLHRYLEERGWEIAADLKDADVVCSVEIPATRFGAPLVPDVAKTRGLLIINEPQVVWPPNGDEELISKFAKVIRVGRPESATRWPLVWPLNEEFFSSGRKLQRACIIAANKLSFIEGELYGLRRRVSLLDERIDLFGRGWGQNAFQTLKDIVFQGILCLRSGRGLNHGHLAALFKRQERWLGPVVGKLEANSVYKVSVVIENSADYMSEKLMEAISAGSIPVYVGPDSSQFGIPASLVVQVQPEELSVMDGISSAMDRDYEDWSREALAFLSDPGVSTAWSLNSLWDRIHNDLSDLAAGN